MHQFNLFSIWGGIKGGVMASIIQWLRAAVNSVAFAHKSLKRQ
jgi:hypothetical protein